ncbi:VOC family protein [Corynebacterium sp. SCR221107]|uniref:VOC family protein n=1 Tax=Corynebacterium sp. SCR221107 TaxID=3017361 RepID=UPI0022EC816D|nr:VOC family protein [Corynebacterium sp. SCR221107]WBT09152.1 VOC family protein [Corynebacterium sp. SCR221107]
MQKIVPNIWCNGNALEVGEFYADTFPKAKVTTIVRYPTEGLPDFQKSMAGKPLTVDVDIDGYRMTLVNGDDHFAPNPTISFMVTSPSEEATCALWDALAAEGAVMMEFAQYPFNPLYGWVEDRYGVSWQLLTDEAATVPYIYPNIMFCGQSQNRAKEAIETYTSIFDDSEITHLVTYGEMGTPANGVITQDSVVFSTFTICGETVGAMDSAVAQNFDFDCGVALLVNAHGQQQLDRYWDSLSAVPEAEQCGWLRDKFGLWWEIVPDNLDELMAKPGAYAKLMGMGKIVIDEL